MNLLTLFLRVHIGRTGKTVLLALLLLGILMLPLVPLCLYDSSLRGLELGAISFTNDSHFQISSCSEQDLPRFEELEDCAVWLEDGTVFIKYLLPFTEEAHEALRESLFGILIHFNDGVPRGLNDVSQVREGYRSDTSTARPYAVLTALFLPLSAGMLCAALRSHIRSFRKQTGILYALGGTYRQVRQVLLLECAMVLTLSTAAAYGLVFCVMKLFYRLFLQIDGAQITVVWNCFFLDARHFIPVLGGLLLLGLTASLLFCRQYRRQEPLPYMRLEPVLKHPARRFTLRKSGGVPMLLALWQRRYRNLYAVSALLSAVILGAAAYSLLYAQVHSRATEPQYDISITRTIPSEADRKKEPPRPQFTEQELLLLRSLDGVEQLEFDRPLMESNLVLHLPTKRGASLAELEVEDVPCVTAVLCDADDLPAAVDRPDASHVLLYGSWADTLFQAGSRIRLSSVEHLRKEVYDENGQIVTITVPRFWKTREFIVQERIETDAAADQPILYLDHALLEELLGVVERPGRAYLRLTDRTRSAELAAQLREKLPGLAYSIDDLYGDYLAARSKVRGELLLALLVLLLSGGITLALHTLFTKETFSALRPSIGILLHLGASPCQLRRSFRLQAGLYALLSVGIGTAAGITAGILFYRPKYPDLALTVPTAICLAALLLIGTAGYLLPVVLQTKFRTQEEN